MPDALTLVLANQIFIAKADLPQSLANRLIRLAAFQNPEFHKAQAMRLPVWNKPRIIGCAENFPQHFGLPRGCLDAVLGLLEQNDIRAEIQDERVAGCKVVVKFTGELRKDQKVAVRAMLKQESGFLCAPTAFGKTITAAALIAKRKLSTLVLAMPISWKGTLQQYAGRLHREHKEKQDVRIYDYVEHGQTQLVRMWDKRRRGYRAMGYVFQGEDFTVGEIFLVSAGFPL